MSWVADVIAVVLALFALLFAGGAGKALRDDDPRGPVILMVLAIVLMLCAYAVLRLT